MSDDKPKGIEFAGAVIPPGDYTAQQLADYVNAHSATWTLQVVESGMVQATPVAMGSDSHIVIPDDASDELDAQSYEPIVHAHGFPSFGPPTMCGEGEPTKEVVSEVTCQKCIAILENGETIAARSAELHEHGYRLRIARRLRNGCNP